MRYDARLSVTLRLIFHSLFYTVTLDHPPVIPESSDSCRTMSPEALLFCLRNPDRIPGFTKGCTIIVPGAFLLAAPFVLFRLKRWGFAGCRVTADQDGLHIEARR